MAIKAEINSQLLERQQRALKACMTVDSEMNKRLRELIFQELKAARNTIVNSIKFKTDPRGTAHAVRRYTATKYLGGVVSILPTKRKAAGARNNYEPPRKVYPGMKGHRGGNRRLRSQRTEDIMHYSPMERDFILYYVDKGTYPRYANGRNMSGKNNRRALYKLQDEGDYYRGSIAPRNFFSQAGPPAMQQAVSNLGKMVDEEFEKLLST